jgi:hypothetical protein
LGKRCCHIFRLEMAVAADENIWYEFRGLRTIEAMLPYIFVWKWPSPLRTVFGMNFAGYLGTAEAIESDTGWRQATGAMLPYSSFGSGRRRSQHYIIEFEAADFEREDSRRGARDLGDF